MWVMLSRASVRSDTARVSMNAHMLIAVLRSACCVRRIRRLSSFRDCYPNGKWWTTYIPIKRTGEVMSLCGNTAETSIFRPRRMTDALYVGPELIDIHFFLMQLDGRVYYATSCFARGLLARERRKKWRAVKKCIYSIRYVSIIMLLFIITVIRSWHRVAGNCCL